MYLKVQKSLSSAVQMYAPICSQEQKAHSLEHLCLHDRSIQNVLCVGSSHTKTLYLKITILQVFCLFFFLPGLPHARNSGESDIGSKCPF